MGFGGFGAPGMGFGAGPQGSNFNQAHYSNPSVPDCPPGEPGIPGEDLLPPGDDPGPSKNGTDKDHTGQGAQAAANGANSGMSGPGIPSLMSSTFQPWNAAPAPNIPFGGGMMPGSNVPPGFNPIPSQIINQGGVAGLSKKALKKKRKKEREEAQAAALQAKTYAQAASMKPDAIPPPPGPPPPGPPPLPPAPGGLSSGGKNTAGNNAMNAENWPDSLR